jgi:hypothetical protein
MIKRGGRKGQFYLIAAIVIITMIAGIFTIANYSKKQDISKVYDLKKELEIESGKMLDNINEGYDWDRLTSNFSVYAGKNVEIDYIIVDAVTRNITVYKYDNLNKIGLGYSENAGNIIVNAQGVAYSFKKREGENFYFIISQNLGNQRYVATNA